MERRHFTIRDAAGIHARPAGVLVKRMQDFPCAVTVEKGGQCADGKKLFALMRLAVKSGETILISTEGELEREAIEAAARVFEEMGL